MNDSDHICKPANFESTTFSDDQQAEPTDKMSNVVANLGDQPHESLKKRFPEMKNLELGLNSNTMSPCESR